MAPRECYSACQPSLDLPPIFTPPRSCFIGIVTPSADGRLSDRSSSSRWSSPETSCVSRAMPELRVEPHTEPFIVAVRHLHPCASGGQGAKHRPSSASRRSRSMESVPSVVAISARAFRRLQSANAFQCSTLPASPRPCRVCGRSILVVERPALTDRDGLSRCHMQAALLQHIREGFPAEHFGRVKARDRGGREGLHELIEIFDARRPRPCR